MRAPCFGGLTRLHACCQLARGRAGLCDPHLAVRVHALHALDDLVKSRCCRDGCPEPTGVACGCMRPRLQMIAPEAMNWLAGLLEDPTQPGTPQVMMCLMAFLFIFDCVLGDVGPSDPRHADQAFRQASILHAHVALFEKLLLRFQQLCAGYQQILAQEGRVDMDLAREICRCVEVMQSLLLSSPKHDGVVHDAFCPSMEAFAHEVLAPAILQAVIRNQVHLFAAPRHVCLLAANP